jgi:hypothetical protein
VDWPGFAWTGHQCADISGIPRRGQPDWRVCDSCGKLWVYKKTLFGLGLYRWCEAGRLAAWAIRRHYNLI